MQAALFKMRGRCVYWITLCQTRQTSRKRALEVAYLYCIRRLGVQSPNGGAIRSTVGRILTWDLRTRISARSAGLSTYGVERDGYDVIVDWLRGSGPEIHPGEADRS